MSSQKSMYELKIHCGSFFHIGAPENPLAPKIWSDDPKTGHPNVHQRQ